MLLKSIVRFSGNLSQKMLKIWSVPPIRQSYHSMKFEAHLSDGGVVVDLRSDTLTQPTQEMRRAMADAVVGDDVFGEDPTISSKSFFSLKVISQNYFKF